jgi:hypothetical protein
MWCVTEFMNHPFKADSADEYPNPATRSDVVDKMRELRNYCKHCNSITLELICEALTSTFIQVNSRDGEDFESLLEKTRDPRSAQVMVAQSRKPLSIKDGATSSDCKTEDETSSLKEIFAAQHNLKKNTDNDQMAIAQKFYKQKALQKREHAGGDDRPYPKRKKA